MLEMFFSPWNVHLLVPKAIVFTLLFTAAVWEPTRYVILSLRKKKPGLAFSWYRMRTAMLMLLPYGLLLTWVRVFIENYTLIWGVKINFAWYYFWTASTVLLFIMLQVAVYEGIYYFQQWKNAVTEAEELKRLHLESQFDALKVQIQPHFLFNTLNTLVGLVELDKVRARKFTEELAYVYRYLLEANENVFISLEDELNFTKAFFFLLKNRYDEGLYLHISGSERTARLKVPPLCLQMLIENAVKHNVITKAHPLHITVHIDAEAGRATVSNNLQRKRGAVSTGKGLLHLKEKFRLLELPDMHIEETANSFAVAIPILKPLPYESIDH
ncbi:sensor histidine kinase [Chitinophaga sp.]|uniref:sensor histidine kinase n=1 Tax=Chitinophaga sp. TaxID=1869181 RepID=UPI0031D4AA04